MKDKPRIIEHVLGIVKYAECFGFRRSVGGTRHRWALLELNPDTSERRGFIIKMEIKESEIHEISRWLHEHANEFRRTHITRDFPLKRGNTFEKISVKLNE